MAPALVISAKAVWKQVEHKLAALAKDSLRLAFETWYALVAMNVRSKLWPRSE